LRVTRTSQSLPRKTRQGTGWRRYWIKGAVSLGIAALFAWVLHRGALPVIPDRNALAGVSWWGVGASAALWCAIYAVRAGRWYWLLAAVERVPLGSVLRVAFIGFAALVVLPLRTGEVVRPLLILRTGKMSVWAATGTVGAERIIDGLALSALLLGALELAPPLEPLPHRIGGLEVPTYLVPAAAYAFVILFAAAFAVMGLFYWRREWARRTTERLLGGISGGPGSYVAEKLQTVADGLRFLTQARYTVPFLIATGVYWLGNGVTFWTLAKSTGIDLTFAQAVATMGVLGLGILAPNAPGFFGVFQLSLYAALALYLPERLVMGAGAAFVFVVYLVHVGAAVLIGAAAALFEPTRIADSLAPARELGGAVEGDARPGV
jgi:uncharacterized membrane protein YbhN (UPF0104 family)